MSKRITLIVWCLFIAAGCAQQTPEGLWEVTNVNVGEENLTPVAKWFHIKNDGTFEAGNGWLQNSEGKWEFDPETMEYLPVNTVGMDDPFGAFKVEFSGDSVMTWIREEEGMTVTVTNKRITEKPRSRFDKAVGLWSLISATRDGEDAMSEFNPGGNRMVFLRWDMLFQDFTSEGRVPGIWRVDAHRPALDILYYDTSKPMDYWQVSFAGDNTMSWEREAIRLEFERLSSFPE